MNTLVKSITAISAVTASLMASNVEAVKVSDDVTKLNPKSAIWSNAKFADVMLYPQTTMKMNDKKANAKNANNKAKKAQVAAVYDSKNITLMVKWPDATINKQEGFNSKSYDMTKTDTYGDGFAVQFASHFEDATKLPYVGMGSDGREVVVYLQKYVGRIFEPNGNGDVEMQVNRKQTNYFNDQLVAYDDRVNQLGHKDYQRAFVSAGVRSMTEIKDQTAEYNMRLMYGTDGWIGTITRPLTDAYTDLNKGAFPMVIAAWDGSKMNRDGLKSLSSWFSVDLEESGNESLVSELNSSPKGDIANGKQVAADNCAACHQFPENDFAPYTMAPGMFNIGGYATTGYLKESIIDPNAVVVPGYNRNAHRNTPWYELDNGKRISTMPAFDWLDEQSMTDLIAYLKTLKAGE